MEFRVDKLKNCRKALMTQRNFSEEIGISYEHYSKIENSYNKPSVPVFLKMCQRLDKPAQYFFSDRETFLSAEQMETLKQCDTNRLELVLNLLQELYDKTGGSSM